MATNVERYKKDLARLLDRGHELHFALLAEYRADGFDAMIKKQKLDPKVVRAKLPSFNQEYQAWYSEAKAVIKQLLPDRLDDFMRHYEKPRSRKQVTYENYHIEDCLQGVILTRNYDNKVVVDGSAAIPRFEQQRAILKSAEMRFESSLFEIRQLLQADLFDSELDAARELAKNGYGRAAGAVAGVLIEKHLGEVASSHKLVLKKAHPTISDLNDLLKSSGVIDVPEWRRIQRLGDLRNLCDHKKHRDPTKEEIVELLDGVDKLMKTVH